MGMNKKLRYFSPPNMNKGPITPRDNAIALLDFMYCNVPSSTVDVFFDLVEDASRPRDLPFLAHDGRLDETKPKVRIEVDESDLVKLEAVRYKIVE